MTSEIYKILYVENNPEKLVQLKQLIRANSVESKITFDIIATGTIEGISLSINKEHCDLIILQDSPKVPSLKEVYEAIGIKGIPILSLVDESEFLQQRKFLMNEGAIDVGILQQGESLFKQIVRAIFEFKTQASYRDVLEKNAKLTEITAQLASSSGDLIAYFGSDDGIFMYANDAFLEYFGFKDFSDLAATTVLEYVTAEQSSQFKKMMKIVGKTGKEQNENLMLKHPNGQLISEQVILKQGMHDDLPCIELFVAREDTAQNSSLNVIVDAQPISERATFYDRVTFVENLTNYAGSSSWLVGLVLQNYYVLRKQYGVELLENYFLSLSQHLSSQISNLHYVRYSDESIVLLLTNSDMTKVDRLGMAIVSSAEGYTYKKNDVSIHGRFSFVYTNLGDSIESIKEACNRLDESAGLLDLRIMTESEKDSANALAGSQIEESISIDEEFMPLYHALKNQTIKQMYTPVVDFSMKGQQNYVASFNLYNEDGEVIVWNRSFTYTAANSLMAELDQFMLHSTLSALQASNGVDQKVLVPLSMYYLDKVNELLEWIKNNGQTFFTDHKICLGLAEEAVNDHLDAATHFFKELKAAGYLGMIYDVVDVTTTHVNELDVSLVALSESCIGRMSRNISSDELLKFPKLLETLSHKGTNVLAVGVNSPTSMTLVWEYNIPYACGHMIGAPCTALDFDFSQMMM